MKWTLRYAVMLAALVLTLGSIGMVRPDVATANDDVVVTGPTNDKGDPDTGGTNHFGTSGWNGRLRYWARTLFAILRSPSERIAVTARFVSSSRGSSLSAREAMR
jgi:hypothetical protein